MVLFFLDLKKAYDTVDLAILLIMTVGCRVK